MRLGRKVELLVATAILVTFLFIEITGLVEDPSLILRIMVVSALFAIFGENVTKAREFIGGVRSGDDE